MSETREASPITMTDRAATKMAELLRERGDAARVRVFVEAGGCSGYRYGLAPARDERADDVVLAQGELTLLIDAESLGILRGASIDFIEGEMASGFTIDNPNAPATCACGGGPAADRCC
jgi:iron-sulfur cluster assembly accessory protein